MPSPGSIAVTGFNADGTDALSFVAFEPLPAGTVLYFTDNEWNGTGFNDFAENVFALTLTSAVAAGQIIALRDVGSATPTSNVGTVAPVMGGGTNLGVSNGDEVVYVYLADPATPLVPVTFLTAVANGGFSAVNGVLTGTGLVEGQTAANLGVLDDDLDIAAYTGSRSNQASLAAYRTILNTPTAANYAFQDASGDQSIDGTAPDVPFSTEAFAASGGPETQQLGFTNLTITQNEGNSGTTSYIFTVTRTGGTTGTVQFAANFASGGTDGADFSGGVGPGNIAGTIAAGQTSTTVTVAVQGDTTVEGDEAFTLMLANVTNSAGVATTVAPGQGTATGNITNDDIAPSALRPGSIAFTGFNADGNDDIAFVALDPIPAGTVIFFNDREFVNGAFNTGEGELTLTATTAIAPGTVVTITNFGTAPTVSTGTISGASGLSTSGEIVYAFIGTPNTPTTFLAAIANAGFTIEGATLAGTGLVVGQTAIDLAPLGGSPDIAVFAGARSSQTSFAAYAAVVNNVANWIGQDGVGNESIDGIAPDLPFDAAAFTLAGVPVLPEPLSLQGFPPPGATGDVILTRIGAFTGTGATAAARSEVVAYDPATARLYTTNAAQNLIDVAQLNADGSTTALAPISLAGIANNGGINSVAVRGGVVAAAIQNSTADQPGFVALFNASTGALQQTLTVGVLPDQLTFTPDGRRIIVANEAEAGSPTNNPVGSVSIITLGSGGAMASVTNTIGFDALNGQEASLRARGLALFPGQTAAADIEPEYVTVSPDGTRAYVTLQEVNGVAVIDLTDPAANRPIAILPLGGVDHNLATNAFDASDQNGISLVQADVIGLLQPDAIASFRVGGFTYFITANEGDSRSGGLADEVRLSSASYVLDPTAYPDAAALKANTSLGRLNVISSFGDTDGDGDIDQIYTFGSRSVSIFRDNGDGTFTKVRETGGEFEGILARDLPALFNGENGGGFDSRSDNKGPEPEGVVVGAVGDRLYAFVALERIGGVMIYDVTDPARAFYVGYRPATAGDFGPETVAFAALGENPTGTPILFSANEVSGTTTVYRVNRQSAAADQIIGGPDADVFNGRGGADTIRGEGGNDVLDGGAGDDFLFGGAGDDQLFVDSVRDVVFEAAGEGNDRVFASVSYALAPGQAVETLSTDFNADVKPIDLFGNELANRIIGNDGANILTGAGGDDVLVGGGGNDTLVGGTGNDIMHGGTGNDQFLVNEAADVVVEAADGGIDRVFAAVSYTLGAGVAVETLSTDFNTDIKAINLTGNELANLIIGNNGTNFLDGKEGNDVLVGLEGGDAFFFTTALGPNNVDQVGGFVSRTDLLVLDDAVFTGFAQGGLADGAFVIGTQAADANSRIVYDQATGRLFFDADGTGGGAAVEFARLDAGTVLTASDFVVI